VTFGQSKPLMQPSLQNAFAAHIDGLPQRGDGIVPGLSLHCLPASVTQVPGLVCSLLLGAELVELLQHSRCFCRVFLALRLIKRIDRFFGGRIDDHRSSKGRNCFFLTIQRLQCLAKKEVCLSIVRLPRHDPCQERGGGLRTMVILLKDSVKELGLWIAGMDSLGT
jgi:hypothetical protein